MLLTSRRPFVAISRSKRGRNLPRPLTLLPFTPLLLDNDYSIDRHLCQLRKPYRCSNALNSSSPLLPPFPCSGRSPSSRSALKRGRRRTVVSPYDFYRHFGVLSFPKIFGRLKSSQSPRQPRIFVRSVLVLLLRSYLSVCLSSSAESLPDPCCKETRTVCSRSGSFFPASSPPPLFLITPLEKKTLQRYYTDGYERVSLQFRQNFVFLLLPPSLVSSSFARWVYSVRSPCMALQ